MLGKTRSAVLRPAALRAGNAYARMGSRSRGVDAAEGGRRRLLAWPESSAGGGRRPGEPGLGFV
ncbi:Uncharacterized protein M6B38_222545 [Iris pallida]|uniref:Uncharacterized protein n=1 Tax=Iris pallida TaxID=29817 RepID=A0AAX6DX00_IRIPA|nr:Uncharacterized protein M6B38_222545 [Iris pallida]